MKRSTALMALTLAILLTLFVAACEIEDDEDAQPPDDQGGDDVEDPRGEYFDPSQTGPYPIGHRTLYFENPDDTDMLGNPRQLCVEFWYPTDEAYRDAEQDRLGEFFGEWEEMVRSILSLLVSPEELDNFDLPTGAVRDAPPRAELDELPIIIFSHGNSGVRSQNYTMCNHLASHGYLVIAPDHTGNALFAPFPGSYVIYNILGMPASICQRQRDFSFLLDQCYKMNEEPGGLFEGRLDPERVGLVGHSFGGLTAVEAAKKDTRFRAAVDLCCYLIPSYPQNYQTATMFWLSREDNTMFDTDELIMLGYETAPAPKVMLEVLRGGHYSPTDACSFIPSLMGEGDGCGMGEYDETGDPFEFLPPDQAKFLLNTYLASFFGVYVKYDLRYVDDLINEWMPEEARLKFDLG
ncbi:MAG: dienelactone hydrolase family protein [Candidatus Alcyoniella australis]|nr:dienelactone hydrolase family protein [Candidatus Alcyoniella australis]